MNMHEENRLDDIFNKEEEKEDITFLVEEDMEELDSKGDCVGD